MQFNKEQTSCSSCVRKSRHPITSSTLKGKLSTHHKHKCFDVKFEPFVYKEKQTQRHRNESKVTRPVCLVVHLPRLNRTDNDPKHTKMCSFSGGHKNVENEQEKMSFSHCRKHLAEGEKVTWKKPILHLRG